MEKGKNVSRRNFMKQSAAAAATVTFGVPLAGRVLGANDRVRTGFIGIGNRGSQLLQYFMSHEDCEVAALCDVYGPFMTRDASKIHPRWKSDKTPKLGEKFTSKPKYFRDFRELLDQKDIDAVVIATPDHWHAVQTIMALKAGKDIYVEKPLTITLREGRKMVNAAAKTDRIVQVGLNRRGSVIYQGLVEQIRGGKIGEIVTARAYRVSNMYPDGIGLMQPEKEPEDFNWDMWLGPRPFRPYQYNIAPYNFRWFKDYSSQMGNWGVHYMDSIRWLVGEKAPVSISAHGVKKWIKDDRDIPDNMDVTFEFKSGFMAQFHIYEAATPGQVPSGEIEIAGTKGTLWVDQSGYKIVPAKPGQFQTWKDPMEPEEKKLESTGRFGNLSVSENSTDNLVRNFLDCIKSRKTPWCPLEEGHRSTSFAHLANLALELGTRIEWDPETEQVTNLPYANKLLHYEYRKPWSLKF